MMPMDGLTARACYAVFDVNPSLASCPVAHWHGGFAALYNTHDDAPQRLAQAFEAMLRGAHDNHIRSLAFPAIGTGVFAFPPLLAAEITTAVLARSAELAPHLQRARLCVADEQMRDLYQSAFQNKLISH